MRVDEALEIAHSNKDYRAFVSLSFIKINFVVWFNDYMLSKVFSFSFGQFYLWSVCAGCVTKCTNQLHRDCCYIQSGSITSVFVKSVNRPRSDVAK